MEALRERFRLGKRRGVGFDLLGHRLGEGVDVGPADGLGAGAAEVDQALVDLHEAGCDILTITQYLRPSKLHHPIDRWVKPEEFVHWSDRAEEIGFSGVMAGPLVRSSYRAGRLWAQAMRRWGRPVPEHLAHLAENSSPARQEAASLVAAGSTES